jgi:hypothetical protein
MTTKKSIGKCIYCGATDVDLTDEHVVPLSLSGDILLEQASCEACAKITGGIESRVTGIDMKLARTYLGFKTRRTKDKPKSARLEIETSAGQTVFEDVPLEIYPHRLVLPWFYPPAYMEDRNYEGGIELKGYVEVRLDWKTEPLVEKYDAVKFVAIELRYPEYFARMFAKIAYGTVITNFGLDSIEEAYVLPAILGQSNDVGKWVGSSERGKNKVKPEQMSEHSIHGLATSVIDGEIIVWIKMFPIHDLPEYVVVVGRATEELRRQFET